MTPSERITAAEERAADWLLTLSNSELAYAVGMLLQAMYGQTATPEIDLDSLRVGVRINASVAEAAMRLLAQRDDGITPDDSIHEPLSILMTNMHLTVCQAMVEQNGGE